MARIGLTIPRLAQIAKWSDLAGNYTRYGDVLPASQGIRQQYIITNAGDEIFD